MVAISQTRNVVSVNKSSKMKLSLFITWMNYHKLKKSNASTTLMQNLKTTASDIGTSLTQMMKRFLNSHPTGKLWHTQRYGGAHGLHLIWLLLINSQLSVVLPFLLLIFLKKSKRPKLFRQAFCHFKPQLCLDYLALVVAFFRFLWWAVSVDKH